LQKTKQDFRKDLKLWTSKVCTLLCCHSACDECDTLPCFASIRCRWRT